MQLNEKSYIHYRRKYGLALRKAGKTDERHWLLAQTGKKDTDGIITWWYTNVHSGSLNNRYCVNIYEWKVIVYLG